MPTGCHLETARLVLHPLQLADAETTQCLFPHWTIVQYLTNGVPWPYPVDGALTYYRDIALPAAERGDEWHWSLHLKHGPDHLIGCIALFKTAGNNRGFWLATPWQGQGLMTEACIAVTDYWFDVLKFPILQAAKAVANSASRRISEKTGMRLIATEEREYISGRLPTEICQITAEEWAQLRRSRT